MKSNWLVNGARPMSSFKLNYFNPVYCLLISFCLLSSSLLIADERILNYHSDVQVHTDGSLTVTETIRVRAEGRNIKRGIYRDFPTSYEDRLGNNYTVTLNLLNVQRDGEPEPFHTDKRSNGIRIYFGSKNHILEHGIYEYRLQFTTSRQLGFFEDFDELYWNVTGNGWVFPIDHASARIELPADVAADQLRTDFYTGAQGNNEKMAESQTLDKRATSFQTTQGLKAYEGLTVVLGWPKGIITEPSTSTKTGYFLNDNGSALALLLGLLAPLGWYMWNWHRIGRDPKKGVIIPLFKPPVGLTPAACSFVSKMSFSKAAFSAAIISLGVKGYLEIHEEDDDFTLQHKYIAGTDTASKGELAVMNAIFQDDLKVKLETKNHALFSSAQSALNKALKAEYRGKSFKLNALYALPAVIMSIIAIIFAVQLNGGPAIWIAFAILSIIMHILFIFLMRAPTPAGRLIMDKIEGFKMYLDTAEQDRLDRMQSPQLSPQVFESFLPYAFALGVENHWCERFTREFPEDLSKQTGYNPAWYIGNHSGLSALGHLGSDFSGTFSTAISSASSPPGTSSGSGGGGFSGGGGGGGGGGGW